MPAIALVKLEDSIRCQVLTGEVQWADHFGSNFYYLVLEIVSHCIVFSSFPFKVLYFWSEFSKYDMEILASTGATVYFPFLVNGLG